MIRTIRDVFSSEIKRIIVDDVEAARRAQAFFVGGEPAVGVGDHGLSGPGAAVLPV